MTISMEQNLDTTRLMQSSHNPMKESRHEAVAMLMPGLLRIIGLNISNVKARQSNGSGEVVKKDSLP